MPELLVAMLVLLLGIWVVAAKFPQLAEIMTGEKTRDQMARKAEQEVERAKDNVALLPMMIAPYDANLVNAGTNPYGIRDTLAASTDPPLTFYDPANEPNWIDPARPINCVENTLLVMGETFRLPAPPLPDPTVLHFLQEGPAEKVLRVYQPIPLTRDDTRDPFSRDQTGPPAEPVTPYPGSFYLRDDGVIRLSLPERDPDGHPFTPSIPTNAAQIEVNYAWMDSANQVHQMTGEIVNCTLDAGQTVNWTSSPVGVIAAPRNGKVVPNTATATFRYDYEVVASNGARTTTQPPAYYDVNYGHLLYFDASEQGKTLCVDYRLRTYRNPTNPNDQSDPDYGRRIPLAREIHRVPDDPVGSVVEVPLDFQQLDDQTPVFTTDLDNALLAAQPHVIAFDLEAMGRVYSDVSAGAAALNVSYVASGGTTTTVPGWMEGRISFPDTSPAKGSTLLFCYRNLDRQTVQLQRAPATFTEDIWGSAATRPYWAKGRWYRPERSGTYDPTSPVLVFPDSCLTHTVRIEYAWAGRRVVELHTLGEQSPATITLDAGPNASVEIRSVTGVSVKGFATWLGRGKLRAMSVETLLPARLEPTLAKDPLQGALQP